MPTHSHRPFQGTLPWGDGSRSSSDGRRFAVQGDSLLSSFYPRYFGHYDGALALYTPTSDMHSVYATLAISCAPREARYELSGILDNDTTFVIREHTSDTHGFTEHLFRGTIDISIIIEQWDQLVRLVASLKARMAPAHVVMQRLANALTQLGRLIKTIHILRYIHEEPLRQAIQLQLNRGEFRHILARWIFFANQGTSAPATTRRS
jgi:TnpA family transposase